jgi:hypothetical protein
VQKTPDCFFEILFSTIKRLHAIVEWLMSGNALATKFSSSDPDANVFSTTGRNATTEGNIGKIGSEQSIGGRDTRSNAAAVHSRAARPQWPSWRQRKRNALRSRL